MRHVFYSVLFLLTLLYGLHFLVHERTGASLPGLIHGALFDAPSDSTGAIAGSDGTEEKQLLRRIGKLYSYQSRILEAVARGRHKHAARLLDQSLDELAQLMRQPGAMDQPRVRELYRTVLTEYEKFHGEPADTLLLPHGEIFALREEIFAAMDSVQDPLLEDVEMSGLHPSRTTVPMTVNRLVDQSIRYLVRSPERHLNQWLSRSDTYFPMIEQVLAEEGVPDELKYLALVESGLNPRARSWAQAVGMWQFIHGTGREYGLDVSSWVDERMDPELSTRAAARYLKALHGQFGDWHLALAAYNCGPGNVRKAIRRHRQRSGSEATFWSIYDFLPRETRNYVPMYIAAALVVSNPEAFQVKRVAPGPRYAYDTVPVRGMMSVSDIAELAGTDVATIQALNPALRRGSLPPGQEWYRVRLPIGTNEQFLARSEDRPAAEGHLAVTPYQVRRGDTIESLARRHNVSPDLLSRLNGMQGRKLRPGQRIHVPTEEELAVAPSELLASAVPSRVFYGARSYRPLTSPDPGPGANNTSASASGLSAPTASKTQTIAQAASKTRPDVQTATPAVAAASTTVKASRVIHRVRRGDTLSGIGRRYGVSVGSLRSWNGLRSTKIKVGQRLTIHTNQKPSYVTYHVRRGDTLGQIGRRYGVSVTKIKGWNRLRSTVIRPGQRLTIYTS